MKAFSFKNRQEHLKLLETGREDFDLVVIGGGINGAGVARDAAMRGMRVVLLEALDFAQGTSSRSSKLVHGGIRYLENLEFHLVFEALSERKKLFDLAPHLVHPLRFQLPLYQGGRVGMFKMGLGMWLYDALSLFQAPELHERLGIEASMARQPLLQKEKLLGSYVYSDAYMDDDRLVHETLRSANEYGAVCLNYVKALGPIFDEREKITGVKAVDQFTGKEFAVYGRHIVSTVGPWTDELGDKFFPNWKKRLRPTKGIHLTFEKSRLPLASAVVMAAESRIVFGIPRHEMVIVGTTDTDFHGDPANAKADPADIQYLLGVVDHYFPGAKITEKDIVASYVGVRPLVHDGAASEGKTSREHTIETDKHGLTFVMGGKYTTYRLIAEQVTDHVLLYFPFEDRIKFGNSRSAQPLNPMVTSESFGHLDEVRKSLWDLTSCSEIEIQWLADRHGPEAITIAEKHSGQGYWELEAHHAIENTMCLKILDFYRWRVPLILAYPDHGLAFYDRIAKVFQEHYNLNTSDISKQRQEMENFLQTEFAWRSRSPSN